MVKIALRIDQMNRKAVIFNRATVEGDILYYATKINHIADFGIKETENVNANGATSTKVRTIYLDPTNSVGIDKNYLKSSEWLYLDWFYEFELKTLSWTITKGDYILSLAPSESYPDISYDTALSESEFSEIAGTLHIADLEETIYKDGEVCLRTLITDS